MPRIWSERHIRELIAKSSSDGGGINPDEIDWKYASPYFVKNRCKTSTSVVHELYPFDTDVFYLWSGGLNNLSIVDPITGLLLTNGTTVATSAPITGIIKQGNNAGKQYKIWDFWERFGFGSGCGPTAGTYGVYEVNNDFHVPYFETKEEKVSWWNSIKPAKSFDIKVDTIFVKTAYLSGGLPVTTITPYFPSTGSNSWKPESGNYNGITNSANEYAAVQNLIGFGIVTEATAQNPLPAKSDGFYVIEIL